MLGNVECENISQRSQQQPEQLGIDMSAPMSATPHLGVDDSTDTVAPYPPPLLPSLSSHSSPSPPSPLPPSSSSSPGRHDLRLRVGPHWLWAKVVQRDNWGGLEDSGQHVYCYLLAQLGGVY